MMTDIKFSSGARLLFLLIPVLTPLAFTWLTQESFYIPKRFVLQLLFILLFVLLVLSIVWAERPGESLVVKSLTSHPMACAPVLIFLLWSGLSMLAGVTGHSLHGYFLLLCQAGVGMAAMVLVRDAGICRRLVRLCMATAVAVALLGIAQYFGLNYEHGIKWVTGARLEKLDVYSTSGNPNFLAAYLIGVFPLAVVGIFYRIDPDGRWRWAYAAATVIIALCLIYTRTKGAWIGAACSMIFLLFMLRPPVPSRIIGRRWGIVAGGMAVLLAALYLSGSLAWIAEEMRSLRSSNVTIRGRLFLWQVTLAMISDHPFLGVGWGNYRSFFQEYQGRFLDKHPKYVTLLETQGSAESPHNEYLEIAAETGIVGLVLFLIILAAVFRVARGIRRSPRDEAKVYIVAALSGVLALLVHSLFVFPLHLADAGMMFWLLSGVILGLGARQGTAENAPYACRRMGPMATVSKVIISAVLVVAAIFLLSWSFRPVMASVYHKMAWEAMYLGKYPMAVQMAEKGLTWSRDNDELYLISGAAKYQMGLVRSSIEDYRRAYEILPDYMTIYNIGLAYRQSGMTDEAARCFERVIFIRPNLRDAYLQLIEIAMARGDGAAEQRLRERMRRMKVPEANAS